MKTPYKAIVLVFVTAAATAAVLLPQVTAEQPPTAVFETVQDHPAATAAGAAQPLVTGLPDFTRLVEQVAPGVVSIETTVTARTAQRGAPAPQDDIPEIFRRFFGPGFQFPDQRQTPSDPDRPIGRSAGTGFVISEDGYILTNEHVVANSAEVKVRFNDRREFTAEVVGSDQQSDIAVLKIDASGLTPLRPGNSQQVRPGQWAVAIGSPFGFEQSVTAGIVSAVGRSNQYSGQQYVPFIQTDVAINRGNSGGPLLNTSGEVIGVNSQIFSSSGGYQGVSFAIPIDVAMGVAEQLKSTGEVRRGQLGVVVQAISREQATGFGLPDTLGALVSEVVPGSPAEKAGIDVGDIIRSVDGAAIQQSSDLPPAIGNRAPGTRVTITVWRDGRERDFDVTLDQLDPSLLAGAGGTPSRPAPEGEASADNVLGLVAQELTDAQRRAAGIGADEGVRIARIDGQVLARAGLQPGDILLRIGRTPVNGVAALDRQLRDLSPGQTVSLLVRRGGSNQYIAVTVPEASE